MAIAQLLVFTAVTAIGTIIFALIDRGNAPIALVFVAAACNLAIGLIVAAYWYRILGIADWLWHSVQGRAD